LIRPENRCRKRLIREGVVRPARSRTGTLPEPLDVPGLSLSEIVIEQRR
jgi:hypothetical protein